MKMRCLRPLVDERYVVTVPAHDRQVGGPHASDQHHVKYSPVVIVDAYGFGLNSSSASGTFSW